jgi:hypothetical protein
MNLHWPRGCSAWYLWLALGFACADNAGALPDESAAIRALESRACGSATIGERLGEEIRGHSRRDLGWRLFEEDGHYDLERSLRVSKSMDLRFRWRVYENGTVEPTSEPARRLCT